MNCVKKLKMSRIISCIDTHSSGEATRVVIGGIPKLKGLTMVEKQAYFQKHYDHHVYLFSFEMVYNKRWSGQSLTI